MEILKIIDKKDVELFIKKVMLEGFCGVFAKLNILDCLNIILQYKILNSTNKAVFYLGNKIFEDLEKSIRYSNINKDKTNCIDALNMKHRIVFQGVELYIVYYEEMKGGLITSLENPIHSKSIVINMEV